ncbi:hypothetical protein ACFV06_02345 [Streptomyces sp. NPDC059618]|uniref:hypothetical protein n=1 Tax=Streptomyces sp. NPDC059618 TaxID=3346887 RepID=UPI0036CF1DB9
MLVNSTIAAPVPVPGGRTAAWYMNAFKDSAAQVLVPVAGVAVAVTDAGALGLRSAAGTAEASAPPDGPVGAGEAEGAADGFFAVSDGAAAEPEAAAPPGPHAVRKRVAADMAAMASAAPRTRGPACVPYCMKSPD